MGRASKDLSTSGGGTPVRRQRLGGRLRLRRRRQRSPTPSSPDPTASSQERTPSYSEASVSAPPSYVPAPDTPTGSYVAVAPLPVFRGDPGECPAAHLARFDRVCRANNAASTADAARIFPASLDADAALWYDLTTSSSPPQWRAVRAAFLDFFRPPGAADRARAELMSLRQRPGEAVNRYHLRMQGILRRFPDGGAGVPDAFLTSAFVHGLRAEFQDWVAPQRPDALHDAVALALSWERAESLREARRAAMAAAGNGDSVTRCGFCGAEGHEEPGCEVRKRMMELWLRSSGSSSNARGGAMAGKVTVDAEEGGGSARLGRLESAVSTRSAQCQCRKHQCAKKAAPASEVAGGAEVNGAATPPVDK
ncbi:hypothetical protein QYE76_051128 [Lolium multiflorum]|uniref:Retrotransposon gag domain-containing protein n=1 Tax=Lolium multiflorum TaxID=4521 RepID=A0AAD8SSI8_LOLMU|nr:hypothetical protein QYE76_051128 [Lolium multiflorum]